VTKQKALRPDREPSGTNYGAIGNSSDNNDQIGREGFEPSRGCPQRILSPLRLPFRHRPTKGERQG
jgi:hypothetical protein